MSNCSSPLLDAATRASSMNICATLEGRLYKRGRFFRAWGERRAVLKGNVLFLFKLSSRDDSDPSSTIYLDGYTAKLCVDTRRNNCDMVVLNHPSKRSYNLCVPSSGDHNDTAAQNWCKMLNLASVRPRLSDFKKLQRLGRGGYGDVFLVQHTPTKGLFAMKVIRKECNAAPDNKRPCEGSGHVQGLAAVLTDSNNSRTNSSPKLRAKQQERRQCRHLEYIVRERSALQALKHPAIVHLYCAFQDDSNWYMCMECCPGGDLYGLARHFTGYRFPEQCVRAWVAELVSAVEHMHARYYVHRDIKPENILLDEKGHVKLIDLGFVKNLKDREGKSGRTRTICGTKFYLAPEIIAGDHSYGVSVDWWALGVLTYELLVGQPPFSHKNRMELYEQILFNDVQFPDDCKISAETCLFIKELLQKNPDKRLGMRSSLKPRVVSEVREHPFFRGIDWTLVDAGRAPIPWVPPQGEVIKVKLSTSDAKSAASPTAGAATTKGSLPPVAEEKKGNTPQLSPVSAKSIDPAEELLDTNFAEDPVSSRDKMFLRVDGFSFVEEQLLPAPRTAHAKGAAGSDLNTMNGCDTGPAVTHRDETPTAPTRTTSTSSERSLSSECKGYGSHETSVFSVMSRDISTASPISCGCKTLSEASVPQSRCAIQTTSGSNNPQSHSKP